MRKTKTAIRETLIRTNSVRLLKKFKSGTMNKVEKSVASAILTSRGIKK